LGRKFPKKNSLVEFSLEKYFQKFPIFGVEKEKKKLWEKKSLVPP
jgi:hypothetical protein